MYWELGTLRGHCWGVPDWTAGSVSWAHTLDATKSVKLNHTMDMGENCAEQIKNSAQEI